MKEIPNPEIDKQNGRLAKRLAKEFWVPLESIPNSISTCPKIEGCDYVKRKKRGYEILVCEKYPYACILNQQGGIK